MKRTRQLAATAALALGLTAAPTAPALDDYQTYLLHCSGCHTPAGIGSARNDIPSLHRVPGLLSRLPEGRAFLAQVPGIAYSALSNAEIARVLNWMIKTYSADTMPANFTPYTEAEVAELRGKHIVDIMALRSAVVQRAAAQGIEIKY
ncbi:MAG: cytochrome c [Gammaproteobacteria bacterium]|nr:cytochrome c [Gammaproteobacteria bacterium]